MDRELCRREKPPLVHRLPAGPAAGSDLGASHRSFRRLSRRHVGVVVQSERLPAGGAGRGRGFLRGGAAAARLPSLSGLHQLHHLGVHVAAPDLLPEALRRRGEPVRPRRLLQPLGFLLYLRLGDVGAGLQQKRPESSLTSSRNMIHTLLFPEEGDS